MLFGKRRGQSLMIATYEQAMIEYKADNQLYAASIKNLASLLPYNYEELYRIDRFGGTSFYYVQRVELPNKAYDITFRTYRLNSPSDWVCRLQADINGKSIYLHDVDTINSERRQGHASKLLSKVEELAIDRGISTIHGRLLKSTEIGIESLTLFYTQCGYDIIDGSHFLKQL